MTKSELIQAVAAKLSLPGGKTERVVEAIFGAIVDALNRDERVELRGFGSFAVTRRNDDAASGRVGAYYPEGWPERELGWTLWRSDAEGRGYAYEAAQAARDWVFGNLGWSTAVSYINPANTRSIALAERLGAMRDPDAATPRDEPALVYRHAPPDFAP